MDLDEFLTGVEDVNEFFRKPELKGYDMVRFKWRLFGDDGMVERDMSKPVYEAFRREVAHKLSNQAKCAVRGGVENVRVGSCHYAYEDDGAAFENLSKRDLSKTTPLKECLPSGAPCESRISLKEDYSKETAFVNHYMTKTISEFARQKMGRGDACFDKKDINLDYFWAINEKTPEKVAFISALDKRAQEKAAEKKKEASAKPKPQAYGKQNAYLYF